MSTTRTLARLPLMLALLGAAGIALLGWSYVRVERSLASRGRPDAAGAQPTAQAVALRDTQVARARALLDSGDDAGAVAALDRALGAMPGDAEVLALQVRAFRALRQYTAARSAARRILDHLPRSPLAHILLGSIAMQQGDAATARRDLQQAIELDGSSAAALAQMAALDLMEAKVPDARARAKLALARDEDNPTALRVLTRVSQSVPELITLFRRLVRASPGDRLAQSWLDVLAGSSAPEVNDVSPVRTPVAVPCEADADGRLYVRARIGGIDRLRFLVDTGGSGLTLSERLTRRMGMRLREFSESAGVGGRTRHSHPILVDRIDIGGMRARNLMATASDLPEPFDGIVNPLVFAPSGGGVAMEISPARRLLVFSRAGAGRHGLVTTRDTGQRWVTLPYLVDSNHIIFNIVIGGRPATALLDTGASVDMVDRSALERLPGAMVQPVTGLGESLVGFGGRVEGAETLEQVTLRVAGRDFATRRLFLVDLNDEAFRFQVDLDAIVGMERLAVFDIRVDPTGTLSFHPLD